MENAVSKAICNMEAISIKLLKIINGKLFVKRSTKYLFEGIILN